jgi:hypothetical protein
MVGSINYVIDVDPNVERNKGDVHGYFSFGMLLTPYLTCLGHMSWLGYVIMMLVDNTVNRWFHSYHLF